jgi:hypothetical protein
MKQLLLCDYLKGAAYIYHARTIEQLKIITHVTGGISPSFSGFQKGK